MIAKKTPSYAKHLTSLTPSSMGGLVSVTRVWAFPQISQRKFAQIPFRKLQEILNIAKEIQISRKTLSIFHYSCFKKWPDKRRRGSLDVASIRHFGKLRLLCLQWYKSFTFITFVQWEIAELRCFWHKTEYCLKKKRGKHGSAKKAMNISKYSLML